MTTSNSCNTIQHGVPLGHGGQPVARDYVLQEGDRITITPTKIEGAL